MDDILATITEYGNNIEKIVPLIQERMHQGDRKETAEEYRKAEIARNNVLLILKTQRDEKQLHDQERRGTPNNNYIVLNCLYPL
jgi:hypothetical protein